MTVSVPPGSGRVHACSHCGAERTKGAATHSFVLVKSLLVPSKQCDPTLFPNGPSAPFHAIVRAAI